MLTEYFTAENISSLLTLTVLEVVLGLDNIIFISILAGKLPKDNFAKRLQTASRKGEVLVSSYLAEVCAANRGIAGVERRILEKCDVILAKPVAFNLAA